MQRAAEARRALYIQLHSVLLSWNLQLTAQIPDDERPSSAFWRHVLVSLFDGPSVRFEATLKLTAAAAALVAVHSIDDRWISSAASLQAANETPFWHMFKLLTWPKPSKASKLSFAPLH